MCKGSGLALPSLWPSIYFNIQCQPQCLQIPGWTPKGTHLALLGMYTPRWDQGLRAILLTGQEEAEGFLEEVAGTSRQRGH